MDEVLVIGEALVDIVSASGRQEVEHPGGSPANVALGLARLGVGTRLLTRIGDDARGVSIVKHLESSGVELAEGSVTANATSTATARLDAEGVATYDFALEWALPQDVQSALRDVRAVHTGSIGATLAPGGDDVLKLVEDNAGRVVISYDPNARPALMGERSLALERIERIVRASDVVKVSDEDLAWLTPGVDPLQVIETWRASGPALVVLTRGGEGAVGVLASGVVEVPAPTISVVDTVGAGDALMSGLLHGLDQAGLLTPATIGDLRSKPASDLAPLLAHAVQVAAYTCTQAGAQPPTREELDAWQA